MSKTICGIKVDEGLYAEYQQKRYVMKNHDGRQVSIGGIEIMATSADYKEHAPELHEEAKAIYNEVTREIRQYYAAKDGRMEYKFMRHSNFKGYIEDARKIYEDAMKRYDALLQEFGVDCEKWRDAENARLSPDELTIAKATFLQAEGKFNESSKALLEEVKKGIENVRKELSDHTTSFYTVNPEAVDMKTNALIASGMLNKDDYAALFERNRTNPTMLRLLAKSAKNIDDRDVRVAVARIERMGNGNKEMELFDSAVAWGERCVSGKENYVNRNRESFDRFFDGLCSSMDAMTAQPE